MLPATRSLALPFVAAIIVAACGGRNTASQLAKAPDYNPKDQTKCSVEKSQSKPLIVEWPSADRGELEAQAHNRGLVVVRYQGCEMQVLDGCTAPVKYGYSPITRKKDRVVMRDADDLYANVPVGAARLEAKLEKSGELDVDMTMVGRWEAERRGVRAGELQGACEGATHVLSALTVGAFTFTAGADATVSGGATVLNTVGGASSTAKRETLNADGDEGACEKSAPDDKGPPANCGALLRVEATPLELADEDVCARACSRLAACGIPYDRYCMDHCRTGATFRACARGSADECNAVSMCALRQWADWNCKGGGGVPMGSATCGATIDCQNACNQKGDAPCGQCGCVAQLAPSRAADLLSSNACALNYCLDRCKANWTVPDCGACWNEHCEGLYESRCKAP